MEHPRFWIGVVVAMMMMPFNCLATDYTVGDSSRWDTFVDYTTWASQYFFAVGDNLVFQYTAGEHEVLVVTEAEYGSCNTTNSLETHKTGNDIISLNTTGTKYYICGISNHCLLGQKLNITVSATAHTGSPPPPTAYASEPMDGILVVGASLVLVMLWL